MANLLNNQFHNLRLELDMSEYWDFFINKDARVKEINMSLLGNVLNGKCLISFIDISDSRCVKDEWIESLPEYYWEGALSTSSYTLENIGYTGVDNGLIKFKRDEIDNIKFLDLYQNSTFDMPESTQLKLHAIDGCTKNFEYPLKHDSGRIKLNGGFYQGVFKTECNKYQILPDTINSGETWELEFVIQKEDFEKESTKTLNDKYPENKGIFFYIGTRAENKWIYLYDNKTEPECSLSYFEEYGDDDVKIDLNKHGISNFLDVSIGEVPVEWESESMDEYLTFKYYNDDLYDTPEHGLEDFYYEKHSATTIDEDESSITITCWCKDNECPKEIKKKIRRQYVGCCCGKRKGNYIPVISEEEEIIENICDGYLAKCDKFDLISDFDGIEDDDYDYIEPDIDISSFNYSTIDGFDLNISNQWFLEYDNPFLLFDRTCNGLRVGNYQKGDKVRYIGVKHDFKINPFLWFDRTCNGHTFDTFEEDMQSHIKEYDINADLYQNAFALRITDDGAIGYRYLVIDGDSDEGYSIIEGYSNNGIIKDGKLSVIHVKMNGHPTTMSLSFYVNGKAVFHTKEMPKLNLRQLNDLYEKQELVPYNISLGGGTKGLIETILPNYMLDPYKVYPLERHFAGSFIGYLYSFRFYNCKSNFFDILNNYTYELKRN